MPNVDLLIPGRGNIGPGGDRPKGRSGRMLFALGFRGSQKPSYELSMAITLTNPGGPWGSENRHLPDPGFMDIHSAKPDEIVAALNRDLPGIARVGDAGRIECSPAGDSAFISVLVDPSGSVWYPVGFSG